MIDPQKPIYIIIYRYMKRAQIAHKISFLRSLLDLDVGFTFLFNVFEPPLPLHTHRMLKKGNISKRFIKLRKAKTFQSKINALYNYFKTISFPQIRGGVIIVFDL